MSASSNRTVLVTGASGTVGRRVIRELSDGDGGLRILGATRSDKGEAAIRQAGGEAIQFDFDDTASVRHAMDGVDSLFLLTGYTVEMLRQSKVALDAARAAGVRQVVHLGALAPEASDISVFAWHEMIERYIEWAGFDFTHLRPNFFMQTLVAGTRRTKGKLFHFVGDVPISWIDADDIAAVAAAALRDPARHAGKTYPLAPEALRMTEVAAILSEEVGQPFSYVPLPIEQFLPILLKNGMEPVYAAGLTANTELVAAGKNPVADAVFDNIPDIVGRPATDWRAFARKNAAKLRYDED